MSNHLFNVDATADFLYSLDQELTIPELLDLLMGPFEHVFSGRASYDFVRDLRRFSTLRGLCSTRSVFMLFYVFLIGFLIYVCSHWMGLHFIRSDGDGPVFGLRFEFRREELEEDEQPAISIPWRDSNLLTQHDE